MKTKYTGVTWGDYHNVIPYDEAMDQVKSLLKDVIVKSLLKDVIVVGHNFQTDKGPLCKLFISEVIACIKHKCNVMAMLLHSQMVRILLFQNICSTTFFFQATTH